MTPHDIDETDGQPRAYEYEPGDEGEPSIAGRLIVVALTWGAGAWILIGALAALWRQIP